MMVRRRARGRLRAQPLIHLVPNIFTIMSLCFGLTGIRYALDHRFELAVSLIILAGIFDGLDGRSARLLKITSRLGAELDSLADFLSFGVAPAILIYLWSLQEVRALGWGLTLLFATCCALRLARFNSELEDPDRPAWMSRFFTGMPAPAAAVCVMIPMVASFAFRVDWPRTWELNAAVMLLVAILMVSRIPTFSGKTIVTRIQPQWVLPTLAFAGVFAAGLLTEPWLTLLGVGLAYLISLPIGILAARRARTRHEEAAAAAAAAHAPSEGTHLDDAGRIVPLGESGRTGAGPSASRRD